MSKKLNLNIVKLAQENDSIIYNVEGEKAYIVSNTNTRNLLCNPEMIGYDIPQKILLPSKDVLRFLKETFPLDNINIVNILRGGLNFPLEAAFFDIGIDVDEISFLTSERIFSDSKVSSIESKYQKIANVSNATIVIGDIIASGETLYNVIKYLVEKYLYDKNQIQKIIIFTVGTSNTFDLIHKLEQKLIERWTNFQGIYVIFFEAIFTTYTSCGITQLNLPYVDFTFKDGIVSPEYRKDLLKRSHILFEKCAIYDGGARRFEKSIHINDMLNYWRKLYLASDKINIEEFYNEKMGYGVNGEFPDLFKWIEQNSYKNLDEAEIVNLYNYEKTYYEKLQNIDISDIATDRYNELTHYYHIL